MATSNHFNCIHAATLVCESRDRELTPAELDQIASHVDCCPQCQVARKQLADVFAQLDQLLERHGRSLPG